MFIVIGVWLLAIVSTLAARDALADCVNDLRPSLPGVILLQVYRIGQHGVWSSSCGQKGLVIPSREDVKVVILMRVHTDVDRDSSSNRPC
jgi:hypothetical protein